MLIELPIRIVLFVCFIILTICSCEKEVSVSPPDKMPPQGTIVFNTFPEGFRIFINGKDRLRTTPDSLRFLEPGMYTFTLKKDLFLDSSFTVELEKDKTLDLFIDYSQNKSMLGKIVAESIPNGAQIILNGSATGKTTPFTFNNLLPGSYDIKLMRNGYKDVEYSVEVKSSNTVSKNTTMIDTTIWEEFPLDVLPAEVGELTCIIIDENDLLWIGSRNGLLLYDNRNWNLWLPGESLLPHKIINDIGIDIDKLVWIATNSGMAVVENKQIQMRYSTTGGKFLNQKTDFPTDIITSLFVRDGFTLFFGTDLGLGLSDNYEFDLGGNRTGPYNYYWAPYNDQPFSKMYIYINAITKSSVSNDIVVATKTSGIFIGKEYQFAEGGFKTYSRNIGGMISNTAIDVEEDKLGGIWTGFIPDGTGIISSLVYFNNGKITEHLLSTSDAKITKIFVDSNNRKWIGTEAGLITFKDDVTTRVTINESVTGVKIINVTGIAEDSKGNIWITTFENGVFKIKDVKKLLNQ